MARLKFKALVDYRRYKKGEEYSELDSEVVRLVKIKVAELVEDKKKTTREHTGGLTRGDV